MITTFYPPYAFGGDAVFVHRLSNMLARRGHEVDVIHCVDSYRTLAKGPLPSGFTNEPGVTVHGLVSGVGALSPLATYLSGFPFFKGRKIARILASKRFDVIHFHNISLVGGPMVLRYGSGIKLYTLHEHWLICPTHVLFKYRREACLHRNCFWCTLSYRRPPQPWRYTSMLKAALHHVDAFIAPSEYVLRRHLADGLNIPIVHIPPALGGTVETREPLPSAQELGLPARPFFLFVGRLEKLKGLQTVLPLFQKYEEADLVIAGDGEFETELRSLAGRCPRIHFLGRLTPLQLRAAYAQAVALLVPSITFETFGQVIIEAFAARTPVIVRDLGALPEVVAKSGGGLVFRTEAELLEAMERLRLDRSLRTRLGEAGFQAYRARWTEEIHMERYLSLIDDIAARKRASAGSMDQDQARGSLGTLRAQ